MEKFQQWIQGLGPKMILDVCTGSGNFIQYLASFYDEYDKMVGIDTMGRAIDFAIKNNHNDRIVYQIMDGAKLDFVDQSFDVVSLSNSLHHLKDIEDVIHEMARVVKKDGYIIINEMISAPLSMAQISHKKVHHFAAKIDRLVGDVHNETYTEEEINQIIEKIDGVKIVKYWALDVPVHETTTDEEKAYFNSILDRMIGRIPEGIDRSDYQKEAETIKEYIHTYGYDGATTFLFFLQKTLR